MFWSSMLILFSGMALAEKDLKGQIETKKSEIRGLEKRLKQTKREIHHLKVKEGVTVDQLRTLEKRIDTLRQELMGLKVQEEETATQISETESELALAESQILQRQREMAERSRAIYKRGRLTDIELALSSRSFVSLLRRSYYLTLVGRQDRLDCERIAAEREEIARLKTSLQDRHRALTTVTEEIDRKNRAMLDTQEHQKALLATLRGNIAAKQQAERNLEAERQKSASRLSQLIADYQASLRKKQQKKTPALRSSPPDTRSAFSASRGGLPWPVNGRVLRSFGRHVNERLGTVTFNRGIDIAATPGSDVRAVAPGQVVMIDWMRGYGNLLLLHHSGDYFTVYAHLSDIRVASGQDVDRGDIIALSGDSGSLDGPKLHFEVLKGNEALDPLAWLSR
ncbi:MAG: peptidoglycan DD-metalloendopeptidase family protein [Candidatus Latescibacteria bacterium]|nr:peptidoglycan DD-metalloendopeptidase family protein [Candidatus Latescibacterota bacterium]